jgi:hypothetical protein
MSIAKDQTLNERFMQNKQMYLNMWGGLPSEEKYKTKFGK